MHLKKVGERRRWGAQTMLIFFCLSTDSKILVGIVRIHPSRLSPKDMFITAGPGQSTRVKFQLSRDRFSEVTGNKCPISLAAKAVSVPILLSQWSHNGAWSIRRPLFTKFSLHRRRCRRRHRHVHGQRLPASRPVPWCISTYSNRGH